MNLLLDTHVLLWAAAMPDKLAKPTRVLLEDNSNILYFSVVSLWEIVIKQGLGRKDFRVDARRLWRRLLASGYRELAVSGEHALIVAALPRLHKDPFDRLLLAQAAAEGLTLLTADAAVLVYGGPTRRA